MRIVGLMCLLFAIAGCSDQELQKLGKVGNKALTKAGEFTSQAGEQIGVSLPAISNLDQLELANRIYVRLKWDQALQGAHIKVHAVGGKVTLTGQVRNEAQRRWAMEITQGTAGVESVSEALEIPMARGR